MVSMTSEATATFTPENATPPDKALEQRFDVLAEASFGAYRALVYETPGFVDYFRAATPIAIIERGTTARQRVLTGTLADLAELAQQAVSPSLIVIGEVVALRQQLAWFGEQGQGQEAESGHELKLVSLT